jgi:sucrose phosphorylase
MGEDKKPLHSLKRFLTEYLRDTVTIVHILPFFPYSSDDGFSVIDYFGVNPELGSWEDIKAIGNDFTLMFDAVINHLSSRNLEFKGFLKGTKDIWIFLSQLVKTLTNQEYSAPGHFPSQQHLRHPGEISNSGPLSAQTRKT